MISGSATPEGTGRYQTRQDFPKGTFRNADGLSVSPIGIGTYLGNPNDVDDRLYTDAIREALLRGCNLIDSAINYRGMQSEKNIGAALEDLTGSKKIARDEVVICTKGGFLPNGSFLSSCPPNTVAAGCHCMEPAYLKDQIAKSLENLGLETIDLYYIHNPETQLERIGLDEFYSKLEEDFQMLEGEVSGERIRRYGLATWTAFREPNQLSLQRCIEVAERVAGKKHHFKAIQLPFNLGMTEALTLPSQDLNGKKITALQAAHELGLAVFCSASILQGRIVGRLPDSLRKTFRHLKTDAQIGLQFVLSSPGVTAALVGMKQKSHVEENLEMLKIN